MAPSRFDTVHARFGLNPRRNLVSCSGRPLVCEKGRPMTIADQEEGTISAAGLLSRRRPRGPPFFR